MNTIAELYLNNAVNTSLRNENVIFLSTVKQQKPLHVCMPVSYYIIWGSVSMSTNSLNDWMRRALNYDMPEKAYQPIYSSNEEKTRGTTWWERHCTCPFESSIQLKCLHMNICCMGKIQEPVYEGVYKGG